MHIIQQCRNRIVILYITLQGCEALSHLVLKSLCRSQAIPILPHRVRVLTYSKFSWNRVDYYIGHASVDQRLGSYFGDLILESTKEGTLFKWYLWCMYVHVFVRVFTHGMHKYEDTSNWLYLCGFELLQKSCQGTWKEGISAITLITQDLTCSKYSNRTVINSYSTSITILSDELVVSLPLSRPTIYMHTYHILWLHCCYLVEKVVSCIMGELGMIFNIGQLLEGDYLRK